MSSRLLKTTAALEGRKIDLRSLTDGIDTRGAARRFFFNVMAALAVMERELILERTNAGLAAARLAGKVGGRRPSMTPTKLEAARKLLDAGQAPKEVASVVGVSLATLYRHLPAGGRQLGLLAVE
ncbi:recombinase family protein [Massilia sp. TSP1-1-2]|uniref:recombinase family protein n=1 Tax=Massilia sp. TSP1-1-2 TaxID=2804649 RepID=UPI003CE6D02A